MKNRLKLNDKLDNRYANGAGKYQQEQYQKRIEAYNLNPIHCLHCSQAIVYQDFVSNRGKSKFCSRSCSATFNNNQRKQNRPPTLKKRIYKRYVSKNIKTCACTCCGVEFESPHIKKTCSDLCATQLKKEGGRKGGLISASRQIKRSKNEIYFYELCKLNFFNVLHNEPMFNGWDADIILPDFKIAILWNGAWHYKQITKQHSILQVQNRDRIKVNVIKEAGYIPIIIKDLGKFNKKFVESEFAEFCKTIPEAGFEPARHEAVRYERTEIPDFSHSGI